jgi:hypothetical protein
MLDFLVPIVGYTPISIANEISEMFLNLFSMRNMRYLLGVLAVRIEEKRKYIS